jgi:hypothetical protein
MMLLIISDHIKARRAFVNNGFRGRDQAGREQSSPLQAEPLRSGSNVQDRYSPTPGEIENLLQSQLQFLPSNMSLSEHYVESHSIPPRANRANLTNTMAQPAKRQPLHRGCKRLFSTEVSSATDIIGISKKNKRKGKPTSKWKAKKVNLAGTGFVAPAERRKLQQDQPARTTSTATTSKVQSVQSTVTNIQATTSDFGKEVNSSILEWYPDIHGILKFLPTQKVVQFLEFNPYGINRGSASVLNERRIKTIENQVNEISSLVRNLIDKCKVEEIFAPGNFALDTLLSQSNRPVSEIKMKISKEKKEQATDVFNVMDFIDYSEGRIHQSLSNTEEVRLTF